MRHVALLLAAIALFAMDGAVCRILHLEMLRVDPGVILTVFIALRVRQIDGLLLITATGWIADAFGGTPRGFHGTIYLLVWILCRATRRLLAAPGWRGNARIVLVMSLASSLFGMVLLTLSYSGSGPVWILAKVMIPLALLHVLLSGPVFRLASFLAGDSGMLRQEDPSRIGGLRGR